MRDLDGSLIFIGILITIMLVGFGVGYHYHSSILPPVCKKIDSFYEEQGKTYLVNNKKRYGFCEMLSEEP